MSVPAGAVTFIAFEPPRELPTPPPAALVSARPAGERPSKERSAAKVVTIASVGGAAILAGTFAVVFAISSNGDENDAAQLRTQFPPGNSACAGTPPHPLCPSLQRAVESNYYHRNLAYGFGIAAGALAVTAVVLLVFWPAPSSTRATASHVLVSPVGNDGALFGWRAQF